MKELKDYQLRMQQEFEELNEKTVKLKAFLESQKYKELNLSDDEIQDMLCQLKSMEQYRYSLRRRCERQGIPLSVNIE